MDENAMAKRINKVITYLEELSYDYSETLENLGDMETRIEVLDEALSMARCYYDASQKEIALLISLLGRNGIRLPLEGHAVDINDLTTPNDEQKGNYDFPDDCLEFCSFVSYP